MSVNIEWVAHACFRVWRDGGPVIVMDPFNPHVLQGMGLPYDGRTLEGDVVIVSSLDDAAHSCPELVRGSPRVINALDLVLNGVEAEIDGQKIVALGAAEAPDHPTGPKDNALYSLVIGGQWVLHLGDLGYGLTAKELEKFVGRCDILLAIVGATITIPLNDLDFLIDYLKPKWVVPMHYELPPVVGMLPLSDFLSHRPRDPLIYARSNTVRFPLEAPELGRPTIVVLEPSAYQPT